MFVKNVSTFEKTMTRLVTIIVTELEEQFLSYIENELCAMSYSYKNYKRFAHFASALYATDMKFHHANRPQENLQESKHYHSGKHHLFGYKTEVWVSTSDFALHASNHQPESRADISVLRARKEQQSRFLIKKDDDNYVLNLTCKESFS